MIASGAVLGPSWAPRGGHLGPQEGSQALLCTIKTDQETEDEHDTQQGPLLDPPGGPFTCYLQRIWKNSASLNRSIFGPLLGPKMAPLGTQDGPKTAPEAIMKR